MLVLNAAIPEKKPMKNRIQKNRKLVKTKMEFTSLFSNANNHTVNDTLAAVLPPALA